MSNARNALIGPFVLPAAATFVLATSAMAVESGVSPDGLSFEVSFGTVEGREYWLEGRASLEAGDWNPATTPRAGAGTMRTLSVNRADFPPPDIFSAWRVHSVPGSDAPVSKPMIRKPPQE